ncbi:MAG: ATP/GTP-binding protein [Saprospiraceae bacterium]
MIDKLNIENFMTFQKLEIPTLKRVNLIAGKNNSGKTTLLDAIRIYHSKAQNSVINDILYKRGTLIKNRTLMYDSLYNNKRLDREMTLNINEVYIEKNLDGEMGYFTNADSGTTLRLGFNGDYQEPFERLIYVPFLSNFNKLNELWENIVLTPKEDDVIKILRETIEPNLVRFDVGQTKVRVRLKSIENPIPITTLGDGVQRILLLAMSLANAKDSILLIDEIELGLHYSAMEKLWEMIFKYAKLWNIQVFATTHSQDALKTFHYVASKEEYINEAEYIRLQVSRKGENEAIIFDGDRLKDSLDLQLEIR